MLVNVYSKSQFSSFINIHCLKSHLAVSIFSGVSDDLCHNVLKISMIYAKANVLIFTKCVKVYLSHIIIVNRVRV